MIALKMYAIKDNRTGDFGPPMAVVAEVHARREAFLATQQDNQVGKWPQDFDLYYVGDYDRETGNLLPSPKVEMIGNLREIRDQNNQLEQALQKVINNGGVK